MESFLKVFKSQVDRMHRTRAQYETIIAVWSANGWLDEAETAEAIAYLNEKIPVTA